MKILFYTILCIQLFVIHVNGFLALAITFSLCFLWATIVHQINDHLYYEHMRQSPEELQKIIDRIIK